MIRRFHQYLHNFILLAVIISILENLYPDKINFSSLIDFGSQVHHSKQKYDKLQLHREYFEVSSLFTSVWCRGQSHVNRICRFRNLCFNQRIKKFLFLHHSDSIISGLPKDRFSPAVTDFSSVEDHNTQYFNFVDLPATAIENFNVTLLGGHALILKRFNPENLMHVFHDDLLPVYFTLLEVFDSFETENVYLVLADDRAPGPYSYLYSEFLDLSPIFLASENQERLLCFKSSYVGLNKFTLWYQYGFNKPQGKIQKDTTGISRVIRMFRYYFRKQFGIVPVNSEKKLAVFMDRLNNRKVVNKDEVIMFVKQVTKHKVMSYSLETHNLMEIISAVSWCSILIGMHGALLILSIFLPPGAIVLELFPYTIDSNVYAPYRTLATLSDIGIIYQAWENKMQNNSITYPNNPPELGGIRHLPLEDQEIIIRSSRVAPHLCCYNPEWLFRIYQDTVVDIPSFGQVLRSALSIQQGFSTEHHHSSAGKSAINNIHPDEVQDMNCATSRDGEHSELILSWKSPWNLEFVEYDSVEYEIWCQLAGTEDVGAFVTKKTYFTFRKLTNDSLYHVWVRCNADGLSGPFTSNPLVCLS